MDRHSATIVREPRWLIPFFGCFVRAAGQLDHRTLLTLLGYPPLEPEDTREALLLRVATFGEWLQVHDPSGHDLTDSITIHKHAKIIVGEPIYALDALIREFDVYDHELADSGYNFELYRDGRLARRVYVEERNPWKLDLEVRQDIGERLPGEPPPTDPIPLEWEGAERVMIEVLRNLGALPDALNAPVDWAEYRCECGELLERRRAERRAAREVFLTGSTQSYPFRPPAEAWPIKPRKARLKPPTPRRKKRNRRR